MLLANDIRLYLARYWSVKCSPSRLLYYSSSNLTFATQKKGHCSGNNCIAQNGDQV